MLSEFEDVFLFGTQMSVLFLSFMGGFSYSLLSQLPINLCKGAGKDITQIMLKSVKRLANMLRKSFTAKIFTEIIYLKICSIFGHIGIIQRY